MSICGGASAKKEDSGQSSAKNIQSRIRTANLSNPLVSFANRYPDTNRKFNLNANNASNPGNNTGS